MKEALLVQEEKRLMKIAHNIIMEDRKRLSVSGVVDIDSFDDQCVVAFTDLGELEIRGYNLHINKIDVQAGELSMEGEIYSLSYSDSQPKKGGFLSRLMR